MTSTQIQCFIAAANSASFSEAAEKVYMTPPTFGRYISALEEEIGYPLFLRGWKNLRLTAVGELMYEGFLEMQEKFQRLKGEARRLNSGEIGQLTLGILEGQRLDRQTREILRFFRERYPELQVRLERCSFKEMEEGLLSGALDLGVTLTIEVEDMDDLQYRPYQKLKNYMILPVEHPLAERETLRLEDFRGECFLDLESGNCRQVSAQMRACFQRAGFQPKQFICPDLSAQMFALETGIGIMALNENHTACANPALVAREVPGLPEVEFCFAWHRANPNPAIPLFLQRLEENALSECET